jgi:hypothetical protein
MRYLSTLLLALTFLSFQASAQNVDEIINKYVQAMGGKDKLKNLKTLKVTGKMEFGPGMSIPFNVYIKNKQAFRFDMTLQGLTTVQVVQGDSGYYISPFEGKKDAEKMPEDMVKESKDQVDVAGPLVDYKDKGNTVELLGKEDMEGTDTYKLKLTEKSGDVSYIYLDAQTYYQLKETQKYKMEDKEVESEVLFSNYKTVDGITFPYTMETRQVGESRGQVMNYETIEVNGKIDESLFKWPDSVKNPVKTN